MKQKRDLIIIPDKVIIAIILLIVSINIVVVICYNNSESPSMVEHNSEIKRVLIKSPQSRGEIRINDSLYIYSDSRLVSQIDKFQGWKSHGPIFDFDTIPYEYRLADLAVPYELSKKENCDTISVYKDGFELRFLLYRSEYR